MESVDRELARVHGLSDGEWERVLEVLGRSPSRVELGIVSVMWSEHCSYKSSRRHLKKLPTSAPWVLQGPGENAGVIDVGEGLAAAFKMESHNHPSFIEPYQGAATGVGGILRDVFTMGARPVASLNSLRFGSLHHPRMRYLVRGVVAGIGGYGNCIGVPTVGGEVAFDSSYDGNILVNAFTVGLLKADRIFRSAAAGVGSPVVYIGSKTGRDGIHGATMASEEFGADSEAKRPRVQVGDPFTEKRLLEACLELMATDAIVAIQDMGAAGLTSSSCEMGAKGGVGIEIDVAQVPRRETGMNAYEIMLSESQERMLMVVRPGTEAQVQAIFDKWELSSAVIGTVTDTGHVVVRDGANVEADLPVSLLADDAPNYDRPTQRPSDLEKRWTLPKLWSLEEMEAGERLLRLLTQPTIASKRVLFEQYDWSVRASTVAGPGGHDAAVIRLTDAHMEPAPGWRGLALSVDMNSRMVGLDPRRGAALGVIEAVTNIACVGGEAKAVTDCLNFGNPEKPEVMWSFVEAVEGLAEACEALSTPVVSGNVSLYNETEGRPILPTPTVAAVGVVERIDRVPGMAFRDDGDVIWLVGDLECLALGGSELVFMETGRSAGRPAAPDFETARAVHQVVRQAAERGWLRSAHDVAEGGLAVALAESCIVEGVPGRADPARAPARGADVTLPEGSDPLAQLFGEGPAVVVVSTSPGRSDAFRALAGELGAPCVELGRVGGSELVVRGAASSSPWIDQDLKVLSEAYHFGLERRLRGPDGR
jgi:phosphoribosylformylglycinamidine synthase subunit PurL